MYCSAERGYVVADCSCVLPRFSVVAMDVIDILTFGEPPKYLVSSLSEVIPSNVRNDLIPLKSSYFIRENSEAIGIALLAPFAHELKTKTDPENWLI